MAERQTGSPLPFALIHHKEPPESRAWERLLHKTFAQARVQVVRVNTIARWERAETCPRGAYLDRLLDRTGLPTDAVIRPPRFLEAHPEFLADYTSPGLRRGRPRPPEPPSA